MQTGYAEEAVSTAAEVITVAAKETQHNVWETMEAAKIEAVTWIDAKNKK